MTLTYVCYKHNVKTTSKASLQLHQSGHIGCELGVLREDPEQIPKPEEPKQYQMTELFGWFDGEEATGRLINCKVCGSVVMYDSITMGTHQKWHNGEV